ncbi:MAG TPA: ABC transporter permease [Aestuariivirga sp.]|jgi:polar amino acid transport system permease protein|nr:ABC transporter permease [Hyphomicrobiales bacterium]MBZ0259687.1 ABC transporter permease [Hyphomicrobiales bacterium]MCC7480330.1 ABC transporter permease [Hyphomicrobiales bacterium]HQY72117.1 ABC transporter permease [Aestuariivirga sp.]HRA93028.1 ABC transporter permease [Aestuariivirga sp.]
MNWTWFPEYLPLLFQGVWLTIQLLVLSMVFGLTLAVPVGLVQVTGPKWLARIARGYCTLMRGTPLLVQLWLLYFGLGSVFAAFPEVRQSIFWPILREGYFYAILAFTLNEGGYGGEIMRGAFLSVPKGELEAARAYGMSPWKVLHRVWLPRAVRNVLPTLASETVLMLKATPLAATVTVLDIFGVILRVRQNTYITYEPLITAAIIYMALTFLITRAFNYVEGLVPSRR